MNRFDDSRLQLALGLLLLLLVAGGVTDLYFDRPESLFSPHVLLEASLVVVSFGLGVYLLRSWYGAARSLQAARRELAERGRERDRWREQAEQLLRGLGREIERQFDAWDLTPAEKEVALLVVKGNSHKAIASMTDRSERTVRQHATSVYAKADLRGRHELAAFFLHDLMLPSEEEKAEAGRG
ncbi:MAG: LuxR C-terminal-related transcriptional regulator [Gemmatimonadales bacterium]|jgi:DNA-binding CsgD family transcriptional regulator